MRTLVQKKYLLRRNMLKLIGLCLFCYFSWHMALGARGYIRLMSLERQVVSAEQQLDSLQNDRQALEQKVVRLRPSSLDPDLLEERVRRILGYVRPDEHTVLSAK